VYFLGISLEKINCIGVPRQLRPIDFLGICLEARGKATAFPAPRPLRALPAGVEQNPEKIDWAHLSMNPNAIHLLEANPEKINWYCLSRNPNAIHILEANPGKINWQTVWGNPAIFDVYESPVLK
jgi:hypothetical protein